MDHVTLTLNPASASNHAGRQDQASLLLEEGRPDDEVRNVGFVLDGHEHDPFGRPRLLPHEHQPRDRHPLTVTYRLEPLAAHYSSRIEVLSEKSNRMLAKCETFGAIILHNLPPLRHRREQDFRLDGFRPQAVVAVISRGEKRQGPVTEAFDLP
ncbi:MAG: hypothetical protein K0S56_4044 [Microvirga sp.]|nr:hypothetical protein [Microvirga sp.]